MIFQAKFVGFFGGKVKASNINWPFKIKNISIWPLIFYEEIKPNLWVGSGKFLGETIQVDPNGLF